MAPRGVVTEPWANLSPQGVGAKRNAENPGSAGEMPRMTVWRKSTGEVLKPWHKLAEPPKPALPGV